MRIVYTCPLCGADIEDITLLSNPPIPIKRCTECDWWWSGDADFDFEEVRLPFIPPIQYDWNASGEHVPACCRNCQNHPSNGGSGMCMCTLPYFSGEGPKYNV